jgi:peptide/nickel transport system permease protein
VLIGQRLLQALPALAGIIVVTFALTRALPGDPAVYFAGDAANAASIAQVRTALGLDRSMPEQFWLYLIAAAHSG